MCRHPRSARQIEKTDATASDLKARFSVTVTALVLALTEDERITSNEQRKAASGEQVASAGCDALVAFAADTISKARELRLASRLTRESRLQPALDHADRDRKLAHCRRCVDLLEHRLTDSPLVTQLRTELEDAPGMPNRPRSAPAPYVSEASLHTADERAPGACLGNTGPSPARLMPDSRSRS